MSQEMQNTAAGVVPAERSEADLRNIFGPYSAHQPTQSPTRSSARIGERGLGSTG